MANPKHVKVVRQGNEAIRAWRSKNRDAVLDLRDVDLSGADLSGANLMVACLTNANLCGTKLIGANLTRANLTGANLLRSNLTDADLTAADLIFANLSGSELRGTDFRNAQSGSTIFGNVDLSATLGLNTLAHFGPSTIGIDTLMKSLGKVPEEFLDGCGVPDDVIAYLPSLFGNRSAIEFYSCFISYSHQDEEFCKRLHSRMRDEKLRVWYAPEDLKRGRKIHEEIDSAIRLHDKLLLILSHNSMKSEWVATEIYKARKREKAEGKRVLFPVRLCSFSEIKAWECFDADTGKDMAREIREYYIPDDFSDWKNHDAFEAGFAALLRDLKKQD